MVRRHLAPAAPQRPLLRQRRAAIRLRVRRSQRPIAQATLLHLPHRRIMWPRLVRVGGNLDGIMLLRQGSTELDSSWPTERDSPVMLSAAKHLCASRDRPFAARRRDTGDCSNGQGLFFTIEPGLTERRSVA